VPIGDDDAVRQIILESDELLDTLNAIDEDTNNVTSQEEVNNKLDNASVVRNQRVPDQDKFTITGARLAFGSLLVSLFIVVIGYVAYNENQTRVDILLRKANGLQDKKGGEREMIKLANQALEIQQSSDAFFYRAYAKYDLGDKQGAIADYNQAIAINSQDADAFNNRGTSKYDLGDKQGAIADYNQAITINPQYANAFKNRGNVKYDLGNSRDACTDYRKAIALGHQSTAQWLQSDGGAWCRTMP